jgi:monooxygenase
MLGDGLDCDVAVVGGGPGGAAIARLLALAGFETIVLEASSAVREEYRAELIQPSSGTVLEATGAAPEIRARARRVEGMEVFGHKRRLFRVDYEELGKGTALLSMPIHETRAILLGHNVPAGMTVRMGAKVSELIIEDGVVCGVSYRGRDGSPVTVRARLVIGADGRSSRVRRLAGIEADTKRYSVQIITMNGQGGEEWLTHLRLHVHSRRFMALAPAPDGNVRMAWALPVGTFAEARKQPIESLVGQLIAHVPYTEPWAKQVDGWDKVHLQPLDTAFAHEWARDGLLLIGDAAHAVSPFGGQGLNMALHDALIATPLITEALSSSGYPQAQVLGRLQPMRSAVARTTLKGGDIILTVFGPRFPQVVRETVMTIGGKLRAPNRFMLPKLALGTATVRTQLTEGRAGFDRLAAQAATAASRRGAVAGPPGEEDRPAAASPEPVADGTQVPLR